MTEMDRDSQRVPADQAHAGEDEPGQLTRQTEGLDADEIRRVAGPDWPAGTQGDLEVEPGSTEERSSRQ
ncbi:MAG TPA: hypothetical protein VF763_01560 [Candidatus Limnocylindrales bacterium]